MAPPGGLSCCYCWFTHFEAVRAHLHSFSRVFFLFFCVYQVCTWAPPASTDGALRLYPVRVPTNPWTDLQLLLTVQISSVWQRRLSHSFSLQQRLCNKLKSIFLNLVPPRVVFLGCVTAVCLTSWISSFPWKLQFENGQIILILIIILIILIYFLQLQLLKIHFP